MSKTNNLQSLALYHYTLCPYCAFTKKAIKQLGLNIEQRNTSKNHEYRAELIKGGGKSQVPCLRIETDNGDVHWLYESQDIIQFVRQNAKIINQLAETTA